MVLEIQGFENVQNSVFWVRRESIISTLHRMYCHTPTTYSSNLPGGGVNQPWVFLLIQYEILLGVLF